MKKITKTDKIVWFILFAALMWLLYEYSNLPDIIPTHFNMRGEADGYGSKTTIFWMWGVALGMDLLFKLIPKIDPRSDSYQKFSGFYGVFRVVMVLFMLGVNVLIVSSAKGAKLNITQIIVVATGVLFAFIGNYMPKIKHNYTMGIRTPWTLASESVWYKTHRFAGAMWFAGGVIIAFTAFIPNSTASFWAMLAVTLVMSLVPMAYSYFEFKKEKGNESKS